MAKNSCGLTSNEMLWSACTGSPRIETNSLETFCTSTVDTVSLSPRCCVDNKHVRQARPLGLASHVPPRSLHLSVGTLLLRVEATRATAILHTPRLAMPREERLRYPAHGH